MLLIESQTAPDLMQGAAARFIRRLDEQSLFARLPSISPPPYHGALSWQNVFFSGGPLKRGHVELFEIPGHFAVLHVCLIPHTNDAFPIMGFDMIAGHAQATGIFLDFSPVSDAPPLQSLRATLPSDAYSKFMHPRIRPDWGGIFSDDFFAIRPGSLDETEAAISLAEGALSSYLSALSLPRALKNNVALAGQSAYAHAQRSNPHTLKMLARHVGSAAARAFIDDVLFPLPV